MKDHLHFSVTAKEATTFPATLCSFLGAGAIIQSRGTIVGLTTAATIWVVAAIGLCVGMGHIWTGLIASIWVILVLVLIGFAETLFLGKTMIFHCDLVVEGIRGGVRKLIREALEENNLTLENFDQSNDGKVSTLRIKYRGRIEGNKTFVLGLWTTPGVLEVKQK